MVAAHQALEATRRGEDRSPTEAPSSVLVSLEVLMARLAALLVATPDPGLCVAVVAVSLAGGARRREGPALEKIRDDDLVAAVGSRTLVACAAVRKGSGPEAFRGRVAEACIGKAGEAVLAGRSAVAVAAAGSGASHEELVRRVLEDLQARGGRPEAAARRPEAEGVPGGLSKLAIRGGGYLVAREGLGMVVRLVGVVLTVRAIGPAGYGIYSGAAAFVALVAAVAQMGVETYLMRQPGELTRRHYDVAFTFLVATSLACTAVAFGLVVLATPLLRPVGVAGPLRILLLSVPLNVCWAPAQAAIERQFRYRAMGLLELGGDLVLYGTAVPLALAGAGPWSLVAGFLALQGFLLAGGYAVAGLRPRLAWSAAVARELFRHGMSYSLATWAVRLRGLVNPLVVGSIAGATGVGYVAFALRLVDTIGFARRGAYRLGMVAMGQVPSDQRSRLRYAIEEGTVLQLIALAVPFAGFGLFARQLIPLVFGAVWLHAMDLYVLCSIAAVLGSVELVQTTFLFSRGRNLAVAAAAAASTAVLALAALPLVQHLGVDGYGVAMVVSLVDLWVVDRAVRRAVPIGYRSVVAVAAVTTPLLLLPLVPFPAALLLVAPCAAMLARRAPRAEARRLWLVVRSALGRPRTGTAR